MQRKSLMAILLIISIIANVVFFVFAYVQKASADDSRQEISRLKQKLSTVQRQAKAQLDQCDGLRAQADEARENCEQKILTIVNRK